MGKKGKEQKRYSAEFKISVIMDMREHYLSYRETVRKYWETKSHSEEDFANDQISLKEYVDPFTGNKNK